jgi:uncharacterized protein (DUF1800 family)
MIGRSWLRIVVAAGLCVLLVDQPLMAAAAVKPPMTTVRHSGIGSDEQILHALNRFTFGPRPGDVEAVKAMGLDRWFALQLNPEKIDDSALATRLAMFPAMQMRQSELIARYPSPQMLRQMERTNASLPRDPMERALYADLLAFYKDGQAKKAAGAPAGAVAGGAAMKTDGDMAADGDVAMAAPTAKEKRPNVNLLGSGSVGKGKNLADKDSMAMEAGMAALPGDLVDPTAPSMEVHEDQFYSDLAAAKIINLPPDERIQRVMSMKPDELVAFRKSLSRNEVGAFAEGLSPEQRELMSALRGPAKMVGDEVLESRLIRDLYSERQLEAVMTDFWLNHFNIYIKKNANEPYLLPQFERNVVRPRALGKFEDLLVATAKSPAMLTYLDNQQSVGPSSQEARNGGQYARFAQNPQVKQALKDRGLNENYARELMELHTLGVACEVSMDHPVSALDKSCGQGYSQRDVTQVALVLTGWSVDRPACGSGYVFEERRHEPGTKLVLGAKIGSDARLYEGRRQPGGYGIGGRNGDACAASDGSEEALRGQPEGLQVLHILATSAATAKLISTKLAVRFVSDAPPASLVDKMSAAFLSSGGDMKVVLRTMFDAPEFWSPEVYRAKVKTPLEFVTSAVRASGADVTNAQPLVGALQRLGMPLYGMQTPNGYSWTSEPWVNTGDLVNRMNFALVLAGNRMNGVRTDWAQMLGGSGDAGGLMQPVSMRSAGEDESATSVTGLKAKEQRLEMALLGQPVGEKTRATVITQANDLSAQQEAEKNFAIQPSDLQRLQAPRPGGPRAGQNKPQAQSNDAQQVAVMAGLLLGSPEFQRR